MSAEEDLIDYSDDEINNEAPAPASNGKKGDAAAAGGNFVVPLFRQGSNDHQPGEPVDPLPHYIPPRNSHATNPELAARFPLNLLTPKSHAYINSSYGNIDHNQDIQKDPALVIHPDDAAARGIEDGATVPEDLLEG